nr:glycosyltransferase family 9 protein [Thaumasiovibrio subtropicus]
MTPVPFAQPPRSICVLRLSAIGDVCHALSVVQAMQKAWPECQITWIVGKVEYQLLHDLPGIRVFAYNKREGIKGMKAIWQQLTSQRFDALLMMQVALRASALSLGIKAKRRIGFSWQRAKEGQWLFSNEKLPTTDSFHVLDNFADFAKYLGVPFDTPTWHIPVSDEDKAWAERQTQMPTVIISPSASKAERNWLPERYAEVADYCHKKGYQVVLCGGPSEQEKRLGEQIRQTAHAPLINLIGQTSLKQLTALLARGKLVIAPDSGPAHLATTQRIPVIGLYAHSNPRRTGPYLSLDHVVSCYEDAVKELHGKAVDELKWATRVKGDHWMAELTVSQVCEQVDRILEA